MPFEKFAGGWGHGKYGGPAQVTLYGHPSQIVFSAEAAREFGLSKGLQCALYYDAETQRVGIEVGVAKARGTRPLLSNGAANLKLSCRSFFNHVRIRETASHTHHPLTRDPESGLLVFDLGERAPAPASSNGRAEVPSREWAEALT